MPTDRRRAAASPAASGAARGALGRRVRVFRLVLAGMLVVIGARLVDVQVLHSGQYQAQASRELTQQVTIPALRGAIYDRSGLPLAMSVPTKMVVADDFQIRHPVREAAALAPLLGLQAGKLAPLLHQRSGYVPLVRHLPTRKAAKVAARAFPGITMVDDSVQVTPNGSLASPVIGLVNAAGKGAAGLQYQYNHQLAGSSGKETLLESPIGVQLPSTSVAERSPAVPGTGLELTLDEPLQYTVEQALSAEISSSHAVSGEAVIMDVRTGQILAMVNLAASSSTGAVSEAPSNLAVTQLYEPGSVFKIVTFSAALASGVITPTTTFTVPDHITVDGSYFHDATPHPTQALTATQILAQSSNVGTSFIAQKLGEQRLLSQVKALGFGSPTGLHFPGDSPGLLVDAAHWEPTDIVSLPIGQVDAVSALQVLDAYNALADGGVFVAPKLVRATVNGSGKATATPPSASHRVIPASTAAKLIPMFEQVVANGTGRAAAVPGYLIAGKTGTAQIPTPGKAGYITGAFMGTFVGFAPANHPVLSAIVVLDRPTPVYGGAVAAPVFSKIMSYALHRYDIPTTPGLLANPQTQVPTTAAKLAKEAA